MAADKIGHPTDQQARVIGASVTRLEDAPLVRGEGLFAADVSFPRQLHMRVVRSPLAHGRIVAIDVSLALSSPGVVTAWTIADIADLPPIDFRDDRVEPLVPYRQPLLARGRVRYVGEPSARGNPLFPCALPLLAGGRVRYVGEPIAVVFAEDPYRAEDAAERIIAEIEELPAILSTDGDPGVFEEGLSTEPMVIEKSYGDIEAAFRAAHAIVSLDL